MTFKELNEKRFSVRKYKNKPIEEEKLNYILECARLAPSAVNYQPWKILVIKSKSAVEKIRTCYNRDWFNSVPMYLIICTDYAHSWKRANDNKEFGDIDAALLSENVCLAAAEMELGTCWVGNFDTQLCKKIFDLPKNIEPIAFIPIGYPDTPITPKKRKSLDEIITIL